MKTAYTLTTSNLDKLRTNRYSKTHSSFIIMLNRLKTSFARTMNAININNYNVQSAYTGGFTRLVKDTYDSTSAYAVYVKEYVDVTTGDFRTFTTKQITIDSTNKDTSNYKGFITINTTIFDNMIIAYDTVINNDIIIVNKTKYDTSTINTNRNTFLNSRTNTIGNWNNLTYTDNSITIDLRTYPRPANFSNGLYFIRNTANLKYLSADDNQRLSGITDNKLLHEQIYITNNNETYYFTASNPKVTNTNDKVFYKSGDIVWWDGTMGATSKAHTITQVDATRYVIKNVSANKYWRNDPNGGNIVKIDQNNYTDDGFNYFYFEKI
jgi:hypothetical protein